MSSAASSVLFCLLVVVSSLALSAEAGSPKIIGGTNGTTGQFPWMCFLFVPNSADTSKGGLCGGNIINGGFHILTAAHCFIGFNQANTSVLLITCRGGTANVANPAPTTQNVRGFQLFVHPQFNKTTLQHDIALLRVTPPFVLGNAVSAIPLATTLPKTGTAVYLAGWGLTNGVTEAETNVIQYTNFQIQSSSVCTKAFGNFKLPYNSSQQICAGGISGHGACHGDSGGALFTTSNVSAPANAQLIGLTSYGRPNCTFDSAVYTQVPGFGLNWVNQQLSSVTCHDGCNREFRYCKKVQTNRNRICKSIKNRCINYCRPLQTLIH